MKNYDFDIDKELELLNERFEDAEAVADATSTRLRAIRAERLQKAPRSPLAVLLIVAGIALALMSMRTEVQNYVYAGAALFVLGLITFWRKGTRAGAHNERLRKETDERRFENEVAMYKLSSIDKDRQSLEHEAKRRAYRERLRAAANER
ncbi:MAG: hypothetical protein LBM98_12940 [Oscillospiraceae bacterium]|jgi:hypothetical protein|nr:hypothetical protein [Oscillospiraceae bacterium]